MRVRINGEWSEFEAAPTVAELLARRELPHKRVAVECNGRILPRAQYAEARLADEDELEIVTLVGGG